MKTSGGPAILARQGQVPLTKIRMRLDMPVWYVITDKRGVEGIFHSRSEALKSVKDANSVYDLTSRTIEPGWHEVRVKFSQPEYVVCHVVRRESALDWFAQFFQFGTPLTRDMPGTKLKPLRRNKLNKVK
jgi:uncharacterized protein YcaQ